MSATGRRGWPGPLPRRWCSPPSSSSSGTTSWARCCRERRPTPMIKIEALTKAFGTQRVLNGVDLEVPDGSVTIVIGRSGGGKSVLLKHLLGLLRPDGGRVLVDGVDITTLGSHALDEVRRRYGVVFQGGALFDSMTCAENIAFPLREKTRVRGDGLVTRVERALAQVGLAGVGPKYPAEVSGGMRKRVAIAGGLVTGPEIVFLDGPATRLGRVARH